MLLAHAHEYILQSKPISHPQVVALLCLLIVVMFVIGSTDSVLKVDVEMGLKRLSVDLDRQISMQEAAVKQLVNKGIIQQFKSG
jgi:hypothetical protein